MTAATGSATAAQSGRRAPTTARHATETRQQVTETETGARPVPAPRPPVPATGRQAGRTVAGTGSGIDKNVIGSDGPAITLGTTSRHLPPQASAGGVHTMDTSADQGAPALATPVEGGPECAAVAYVDALDGSERKLLLTHIAQAWPEVVEAAAGLVAQWRAECAEHRRKAARRKDHDRRARQRRQA